MGKRVLCFGDSNTWGYIAEGQEGEYVLRYPQSVRWPGALQNELGDDWEIIEEGLCGRTSAFDDPAEYGRNGLDALEDTLDSHEPIDLLIIALGSNDLKSTVCGTPERSVSGLASLLDCAAGRRVRCLVLTTPAIGPGIFAPPFVNEFGRPTIVSESETLAALQKELADSKNVPCLESAAYAVAGSDGLHLSAASHQKLAGAVASVLRKLLA